MRLTTNEKIFACFFVIFEICCFTPYLQWQLSNIWLGILFVIVVLILVAMNIFSVHNVSRLFIVTCLWSVQILVYWVIGLSGCSLEKAIYHIMTLLLLVVLAEMNKLTPTLKKIIMISSVIILFLNIVDNIRLNIIYPNASEWLNFSWGTQYKSMNVGGSVFTIVAAFMGIMCCYNILLKGTNKLAWIVYYVMCLAYVIITGRAISLMAIVVGSVLMIYISFLEKIQGNQRLAITLILLLACLVFVILFAPACLDFIANHINSERISVRFEELADMLRLSASTSQYSDVSSGVSRLQLYQMSINTFLSSPRNFFIGIGEQISDVPTLNGLGISGHSAIFDVLPEYGVLGLCFVFCIFKELYKTFFKTNTNKKDYYAGKCIFILYLINAFLNNIMTMDCYLLIFAILPYLLTDRDHKKVDLTSAELE